MFLADQLAERIAGYQDSIVAQIRELVEVPTQNPPGAFYRDCVAVLTRQLDELGLEYSVLDVPGTEAAIVLAWYGSGTRTLYFSGHYDVVPANPSQFQFRRDGDRLIGRGACDMKGGLVAMLAAVRALKECGVVLDGRIGLVFVPDEETGGLRGSQFLAASGRLGADGIGMLMAEPTSSVIWNANRGAITLRVTTYGKPAHVGLQYQGVNAFEAMLTVAEKLRSIKAQVEQHRTGYNIAPDPARHSIMLLGGEVSGGTNFNVVPASCSFTVDRRFNPEEDLATEKARILSVLDELRDGGISLRYEIFQEADAAGSAEDSPVGQALARNSAAVTGEPPAFEMCPGLLETRFYARQGIPAYAYGPGLLEVAHGPAEYVSLERVVQAATIYARTAVDLLGGA